jgi:hypothetical protein
VAQSVGGGRGGVWEGGGAALLHMNRGDLNATAVRSKLRVETRVFQVGASPDMCASM